MTPKIKAASLGLFAVLLWSAIPAFVKIGTSIETLPFLLVLRFAIASLFFVGLIPTILKLAPQVKLRWFLLLAICLGANFYFQGLAMVNLPVSWYLIIFCLNPLFALIFMGIKLTKKVWFGVGLSILGTMLFIKLDEVRSVYGFLPVLYIVIGMITWVVYTLLVKRFQKVYSNVQVTALTQFAALIACLVIWAVAGFPFFHLDGQKLTSALALGALTPLAYFGFTSCLRDLPRFGIVSQYLEPVFGVAIGYMFFQEILTPLQIIGSIMIVVGSVTVEN